MKGLSLTQPWATLVALGAKRVETRSWSTAYRGELLIHAAKNFPRDVQEMCATEPFLSVLKAAGFTNTNQLPRGGIVAVAQLRNVWRTETLEISTAMRPEGWSELTDQERAFGDYSPRRYGWMLTNVRAVRDSIPAAHVSRDGTVKPGGALGLWTAAPDVIAAVARHREASR